jgi:hypothetical protein
MQKKQSIKPSRKGASDPNPNGREGNPVSLAPLDFEEALKNLLQVPPSKVKEAEQKKPKTKKSRTNSK